MKKIVELEKIAKLLGIDVLEFKKNVLEHKEYMTPISPSDAENEYKQ